MENSYRPIEHAAPSSSSQPSSPACLTHIKMSNVCNAAQPVEEYIIPPARVAVMNVWDELAAQSPGELRKPERAERERERLCM